MIWRRLHQQKRVKPKHRVKLERLGLAAQEQLTVPMEEIRRQGILLAGLPFGQGIRSRSQVQNGPTTHSPKPAGVIRRSPHGAAQ